MATAKRKTTKKATTAKRKPAAKKTTARKSTAKTPQQRKIGMMSRMAVDEIYQAGKAGRPKPTWGEALRKAAKKV